MDNERALTEEKSGAGERAVDKEQPDRFERAARAAKLEQSDTHERAVQVEHPDKVERAVRDE